MLRELRLRGCEAMSETGRVLVAMENEIGRLSRRVIDLQAELANQDESVRLKHMAATIVKYRRMGREVCRILDAARAEMGGFGQRDRDDAVRSIINPIAAAIGWVPGSPLRAMWEEGTPPVYVDDNGIRPTGRQMVGQDQEFRLVFDGHPIVAACTREFSHDLDFTHV